MTTYHRARVQLSVRGTAAGQEYGLEIGPGQEVNLDQELAGVPLRALVPADAFGAIGLEVVDPAASTHEPDELAPELGLDEE